MRDQVTVRISPEHGMAICEFVGWDQRSAGPPHRKNGGPALSLVPPYIWRNFTNCPAGLAEAK